MAYRKASDKLVATATAMILGLGTAASAQENSKQVIEPVFRVSRLVETNEDKKPLEVARNPDPIKSTSDAVASLPTAPNAVPAKSASVATGRAPHPLDNAIVIAHSGLAAMKANIHDYTAILVKRETVDGVLGEQNYMRIKIRNDRTNAGVNVPFSVYMKFLKPKSVSGREVIWVEGRNDNKIRAHETGFIGLKTFHLDPDGWLAMQGNLHPIYEAGLENLVEKLIEKAERDRDVGHCTVDYRNGAKINGRVCTMIEVVHDTKRSPYEFHKAQVFIDDELQVPVRYCAWNWPTSAGAEPQIIEEYTYIQIETNVGLTDLDFDPMNPEYSYPGR